MAISQILETQRAWLASGKSRALKDRRDTLRAFAAAMDRHEAELLDALRADLRKSPLEAYTSEIRMVRDELFHVLRHLKGWMKPQRRPVPLLAWPGRAKVIREPCGSVLIIGPWNYPVHLMLTPLVGALGAGNTAVLKPSELAPETSAALTRLIADAFDPAQVAVVEGGAEIGESLASEPFDHIFFTGGIATGRKILTAAADKLVPVTLELGGKCPALIFPGPGERERLLGQMDVIARRLAWGKYLNAGQTCVAPDYVMVEQSLHEPLVAALAKAFESFGVGELGKIVNRRHFDRVLRFLADGRIAHGGKHDPETLTIEPTILLDLPPDSPSLQEEIFGPILPVVACANLDQALEQFHSQPPPLAIYAFTSDEAVRAKIVSDTVSGGVCFNDTVVHIASPALPFGGVGASGMGRYRGKASFDTFTRERVVMSRHLWPDLKFRYPPATATVERLRNFFRFIERH
ncbi:aldehyde dehydrogenase family protein [Haloferula sp. BvORR071]|uniref:aldehyde dehydrogenase family protein n=1 Tax=Haloferula sp. BvORR071 TaxID=1396141 RepID=UPI00055483F2|nr:aldehyde dehydrogenase family protein [Haloferula sp. BvORR071]